jgi:16S rRNA (guanine966-N2)-methyltransferase
MKEGVFSAVGDWVIDAEVLDLYAGSGSVGIEALSRGARRVVFVEKDRDALAALRHNLQTCGFVEAIVVGQDVTDYLRTASGSFDLIFCDPPWELETSRVEDVMAACNRLAAPRSELVVHRRTSDPDPAPPEGWRHVTTRRYGDGKIHRYEKETN